MRKTGKSVFKKYAAWQSGKKGSSVCDPCNHCNPDRSQPPIRKRGCDPCSHCTPCGAGPE